MSLADPRLTDWLGHHPMNCIHVQQRGGSYRVELLWTPAQRAALSRFTHQLVAVRPTLEEAVDHLMSTPLVWSLQA